MTINTIKCILSFRVCGVARTTSSMQAGSGRAYRRHQLVSTPDAGHLVLIDELFDGALHGLVPSHEQHVRPVQAEQHQRLLPVYVAVLETVYQDQKTDRVERTVTEQRPPSQGQGRSGKQRAGTDHEQNVEDR